MPKNNLKPKEHNTYNGNKTQYAGWNIYQKISAIREEISKTVIEMTGKNQKFVYPYFKLPELQKVILPLEKKYGVMTSFNAYPETIYEEAIYKPLARTTSTTTTVNEKKLNDKGEIISPASTTVIETFNQPEKMSFLKHGVGYMTTINTDKPNEKVITDGIPLTADMDDSSKAGGSGWTYGQRYGYLVLYQIQNYDKSEDVDSDDYANAKKSATEAPKASPVDVKATAVVKAIQADSNKAKKVKEMLDGNLTVQAIQEALAQNINFFNSIIG